MKGKAKIFFVLGSIMFILFIWGRAETQGDRSYSVYRLEKAITKSGKEIPLGWEFSGPRGDPVASFKITVEGRTEKAEAIIINLVAADKLAAE